MTDSRVKALCEEFEIEIIPGNRYPQPGQTRTVASIQRLIDHHGRSMPASSCASWRRDRATKP